MKEKALILGVAILFLALVSSQRHIIKKYIVSVSQGQTMQSSDLIEQESTAQEKKEQQKTGEGKTAYLTFDDGPGGLTEEYLDILKKHKIQATFFLIGQQVDAQGEKIVRREIKEGHEVGVHTFTHESGEIYVSADAYFQDVCKVKELLKEKFDYKPRLWRFPWGSANSYIAPYRDEIIKKLRAQNMEFADWNVSAEDSVGSPSVDSILMNIKKDCFRVEDPVILMHDSNSNCATRDSLEEIIQLLEEKDYQFGTLSERKQTCHFGEYH